MYCVFGGLTACMSCAWYFTSNFGGIYAPVPVVLLAAIGYIFTPDRYRPSMNIAVTPVLHIIAACEMLQDRFLLFQGKTQYGPLLRICNFALTIVEALWLAVFDCQPTIMMLTTESMLADALAQSGQNVLGLTARQALGNHPEEFEESIRRYLVLLRRGTPLSRTVQRACIVGVITARMRVVAYHCAHPEAKHTKVKPLIIMGMPRTGTTLLQSCLALDTRSFRPLRQWELMRPVPYPATDGDFATDTIRRQNASQLMMAASDAFVFPEQKLVTGFRWDSVAEDWPMLALGGLSNPVHVGGIGLGSITVHEPLGCTQGGFYEWCCNECNQQATYDFFHISLQAFCHSMVVAESLDSSPLGTKLAKEHTMLLKCPEHLWFIEELFTAFPEAHAVWIHRDPAPTIVSYAVQASALCRVHEGIVDPKLVGPEVAKCFADGVRRGIESQGKHARRIRHLEYADLISNLASEVRGIKEWAGVPHDDASDKLLQTFLSARASLDDKDITHLASPKKGATSASDSSYEHFGLSKEMIEKIFPTGYACEQTRREMHDAFSSPSG